MTYNSFLNKWRSDDEYCTVTTSGSTGKPKKMELPKELMRKSARRTVEFFGIPEGARIHSCISPDFIGGKMMAVRAEECGLKLTYESPSNRPDVNYILGHPQPPALVAVVPSQMIHILDNVKRFPKSDTVWLIGGGQIDKELRNRIASSGLNAWESYGMTETASHVALRKITHRETPFIPMPGVEISKTLDGRLKLKQFGQELETNDLVRLTPGGGFTLKGRADNVIVTGGKKVQPEHVENVLRPLLKPIGVLDLMIASRPNYKWGRSVVLMMEIERNVADVEEFIHQIDEICRRELQPHEVPKEYKVVDSLPRTANGKLRRNKFARH